MLKQPIPVFPKHNLCFSLLSVSKDSFPLKCVLLCFISNKLFWGREGTNNLCICVHVSTSVPMAVLSVSSMPAPPRGGWSWFLQGLGTPASHKGSSRSRAAFPVEIRCPIASSFCFPPSSFSCFPMPGAALPPGVAAAGGSREGAPWENCFASACRGDVTYKHTLPASNNRLMLQSPKSMTLSPQLWDGLKRSCKCKRDLWPKCVLNHPQLKQDTMEKHIYISWIMQISEGRIRLLLSKAKITAVNVPDSGVEGW